MKKTAIIISILITLLVIDYFFYLKKVDNYISESNKLLEYYQSFMINKNNFKPPKNINDITELENWISKTSGKSELIYSNEYNICYDSNTSISYIYVNNSLCKNSLLNHNSVLQNKFGQVEIKKPTFHLYFTEYLLKRNISVLLLKIYPLKESNVP
ncbi:MAG TPA: hypothetical protein P5335_09210 [Flavobacterium sp.]|nr:hypothetical protein [Flavobacterium sp.]HRZ75096.1 hypothetical protein [Flavobacterium sp.]